MALRPKAVYPSPPENTIVRGVATIFLADFGGDTSTQMCVQVAENRTDAGCLYWKYNGSTLTAATGPTDVQYVTLAENISFGSTAFNSLTKNNGYKWRVKTATGSWSDWQLFFTVASATFVTITQPTGGVSNERTLTLKYTNTGPSMVATRVKMTYGGTTVYDQTFSTLVPADGTYTLPTGYVMGNDRTYSISVYPKFHTGAWGTASTATFKASFARIATPTITLTETDGYVDFSFTPATTSVNPVTSIDVYRWSPQRNDYILLAEGVGPTYSLRDTSAPLNVSFWYRIVAYAATMSDVFTSQSILVQDENWYITDSTTRYQIVVLNASFGRTHVLDEAEPLGRDFKVVSRFESGSREGNISIDIRPEERDTLPQTLYELSSGSVTILSPYGDTFTGNITELSIQDDIYGSAVMTIGFIEEVAS